MKKDNITVGILEDNIERLKKYFEIYPDKKAEKEIDDLVTKLNNQEYKIAVVANMSAGKSTFINALFGQEVLPSFNHATTDSATYIHSEVGIEQKAIIDFSDGKKQVEIKEDLEQEIKKYAQKDEDCKDDRYKNVEKIELFYPFQNLQTSSKKDFKIIFVDTPGPNSTGDYQEKHKDQTRSVLNDVDLALFMFDYTQLDANLSSDEQGLWHTIKERHDKDKNFDVYFVLNKIDEALNDNFKDIKSKDDYYKLKKENWYKYEEIAIEKLKEASKKHGIDNPKIFPVSSKFQLLDRLYKNNVLLGDDDIELDIFKMKHFRKVFDSSWEDRYIEYLGISKLEEDINRYIDESVKQKILKRLESQINTLVNEENKKLDTKIQVINQPKEKAEKNLEKAEEFLNIKAKEMNKEMKKESTQIEKKYIKKIESILDTAIQKEFRDNIDYMSKRAIAFAQAYALDGDVRLATKKSEKNASKINLKDSEVNIEIGKKVDKKVVMNEMMNFLQRIFEDYKRNYLDSKSDIKDVYFEFERESKKLFTKYQDELQKQLDNTLDVKTENLLTINMDYDSILNFDIKIPKSVLDYNFKEAQYDTVSDAVLWNPFSWFSTKRIRVSDEKHFFIISVKELKQSIEKSINDSISKFIDIEINMYKDSIKKYLLDNHDIFQVFRHQKIEEIDRLKKDIQSNENSLKVVNEQYKTFRDIIQGDNI